MSLKEIYKDFQSLPNPMAKVEYLKSLQTMNLNHKIKYEKN